MSDQINRRLDRLAERRALTLDTRRLSDPAYLVEMLNHPEFFSLPNTGREQIRLATINVLRIAAQQGDRELMLATIGKGIDERRDRLRGAAEEVYSALVSEGLIIGGTEL